MSNNSIFFSKDVDAANFVNCYKTNHRHSHGLSKVTDEIDLVQLWSDSWSKEGVYVMTGWNGTHWKTLSKRLSKLPVGTVINYVLKSRKTGTIVPANHKVRLVNKLMSMNGTEPVFIFQKL